MANKVIATMTDLVKDLFIKLKEMASRSGKTISSISPELAARLRVQKILDYYDGNQIDYLKTLLTEQFTAGRIRSELIKQPNIRNIVRYLADTVPFTFREGILIQASNPKDQEIYNKILDENSFDNFCRELDRKVYLCKTCFVKVNWKNEGIWLDPNLTPEYAQVMPDELDPYEIGKIVYPKELTEGSSLIKPKGKFCVWTKDNFYWVDQDGVILNNPENEGDVNPYRIIPVVTFREKMPTGNRFWNWPGEELITTQDNLNVKLTYRNYLFKRFNIPVPVIIGAKIANGQYPAIDGAEILVLNADGIDNGSNPQFDWKIPPTKMDEVLSVINEEVRSILIGEGIDPNLFIESADRQSGKAIALMNAKLEERRAIAKVSYQYSLEELFDVIRIVWNIHNPDNQLSDEKVIIQIPEPKVSYASVQEKWEDYNQKLTLNLLTPADILLLERNDLNNIAEAQAIINKNAQTNKSTRLKLLLSQSTPQPEIKEESVKN